MRIAWAALALLAALGCQSGRGWSVAPDSEWREGGPRVRGDEAVPGPGASESEPGMETVYFAFDAWHLDAPALAALRVNAKAIAANPDWERIVVEGHCDERGSEEYNLALGARRAAEVVGTLRDLGIPARRLQTVSYGEARPAVAGYNESAWRWNRRSVFRAGERTASR